MAHKPCTYTPVSNMFDRQVERALSRAWEGKSR